MVPSAQAKSAAEADVRKIGGVKKVVDQLEVVPKARQDVVKKKDGDIQRDVKAALDQRPALKDASISAQVEDGVARLTGTVSDEEQRLAAAMAARAVPGVRAVPEDLRVHTAGS